MPASIPASCGGWAETQAAYRYFANGQVDWQKILSPISARRKRASASRKWCSASRTPRNWISTAGHWRDGAVKP
ncbi:MAG: hypothetical protein HZT40_03175 [Candidatus Thiothrix singaporensis]|uniref:Transposase Tn5-like N-terminal domain-containing protein n=1 Tax=Candidatus Thiothrix singaporensis TaxID=2799669 RepID=A0A7L6ANT6_9GAMM|nr:MAG: hypothetical protein HZT40_03175 [Candidatus Thiothrix singaporensis]